MKETLFTKSDLSKMMQTEDDICVSILLPAHRAEPPGSIQLLDLKRAIQAATDQLQTLYDEKIVAPLVEQLKNWRQQAVLPNHMGGMGLYLSASLSYQVIFPFEVEERVIVGDRFEIRDLVYYLNEKMPYYVLLLSQKTIQLFEGQGTQLNAIQDAHFPKKYTEQYIYEKPHVSSSMAGYAHEKSAERDKSELEEKRFKTFFASADATLRDYLSFHNPLFVLGTVKDLAWYRDITKYSDHIIETIEGNYIHETLDRIAMKIHPLVEKHLLRRKEALLKTVEEMVGVHRTAFGLHQCWTALQEGRGQILLVERDYHSAGFLTVADRQLHLRHPMEPYMVLPDAVDVLIATTLERKGDVVFFEPNQLKPYQHIAFITRY